MTNELDFSAIERTADVVEDGVTTPSTDDTITSVDRRNFDAATFEGALPHSEAVYRDKDSGATADDIDPRKLFDTPTRNEIRWYARNSSVARTILRKPVLDAFKNGVELVVKDDADVDEDALDELREIFEKWVGKYKTAQIKSRRDGPASIFYKLRDAADLHEEPRDVSDLIDMEIMTLDKWYGGDVSKRRIVEGTKEGNELYIEIRDTGLVVRRNIEVPQGHRDLLGYIYRENDSPHSAQFIHSSRAQHFATNTFHDGDINEFTVAEHEGDSVLLSIFIPLKSLMIANWAMGQTVFRYSAPLYAVNTPEKYNQEQFDAVSEQVEGLNSASDIVLPPGTEMETHGTKGDLDPQPYIEKLLEQCCAGTEFTKSVLIGTQTGTVSGSSTDIKNYFNQVQRARQGYMEEDIFEFIDMLNEWGITPISSNNLEVKWGPLFKIDTLDRMEALVRLTTATSQAVSNYFLKPEEAREIMAEEWADLDIDINPDNLDDLSDEEFEFIAQLISQSVGEENNGDGDDDDDPDGNPRVGQNGGGHEEGNETDPPDPT